MDYGSLLYPFRKDEYFRASNPAHFGRGLGIRENMGNVERRSESRFLFDLPLTVWGVDTKGDRFLQEVRAHDISLSGALLSGLDTDLSSGDVIGVLYSGKKARFRVVWIRYDGTGDKMQVAVHRFTADECPWLELLAAEKSPPRSECPATGANDQEANDSAQRS